MANKQEVLHVSRETNQDLKLFEEHLLKNNSKFNLISKFDENILWERHFLDSIQVIDSINKNTAKCVDLGSGAGFPGIVLAIEAKNKKYPGDPMSEERKKNNRYIK